MLYECQNVLSTDLATANRCLQVDDGAHSEHAKREKSARTRARGVGTKLSDSPIKRAEFGLGRSDAPFLEPPRRASLDPRSLGAWPRPCLRRSFPFQRWLHVDSG